MSKDIDNVDHPKHYTQHPSGVECIQIVEHMNFNRGNAIKYIWRAGDKGNEVEDLKKAAWYIQREIERIGGLAERVKMAINDCRVSSPPGSMIEVGKALGKPPLQY